MLEQTTDLCYHEDSEAPPKRGSDVQAVHQVRERPMPAEWLPQAREWA